MLDLQRAGVLAAAALLLAAVDPAAAAFIRSISVRPFLCRLREFLFFAKSDAATRKVGCRMSACVRACVQERRGAQVWGNGRLGSTLAEGQRDDLWREEGVQRVS